MNQGFFNSSYQSTVLGDVASELSEAAAGQRESPAAPTRGFWSSSLSLRSPACAGLPAERIPQKQSSAIIGPIDGSRSRQSGGAQRRNRRPGGVARVGLPFGAPASRRTAGPRQTILQSRVIRIGDGGFPDPRQSTSPPIPPQGNSSQKEGRPPAAHPIAHDGPTCHPATARRAGTRPRRAGGRLRRPGFWRYGQTVPRPVWMRRRFTRTDTGRRARARRGESPRDR